MERASSRQLQQNSFTAKGSGGKLRRNKSHAELHSAKSSWSLHTYPCSAADYELEKEIGKGACGIVWLATCKANGDQVALKILELDNMSVDLDTIRRETQIMAEMRHPNVMPLYCSFVHKEQLWMVMPYVSGGSIFSIMLNQHPNGLEEEMVATIALDVLRGLEYMHSHSMLHRDVKAANVLINHDGRIVLSDFGVTANLERAAPSTLRINTHMEASTSDAAESPSSASGSCGGSGSGHFQSAWAAQKYLARNTFCGTPCFMAPEVMQQTQGYDLAADVWSFGILLEELTLGRAPYANMSLTSVILTTLHQDAPTLNAQKTRRKFSEELHDIVKQCLQKDPALRPTTSQLLKHKFFKNAEDAAYLVKYLLNGSTGTPMKDMLRTVTRTFRSKPIDKKTVSQRNLNVYATAHLSGDVANAVTLLKRMTRPSSRKHKAGLLIPSTDIAACQGVCFTVLHKSKAGLGVDCVRGHGFCVARRPLKSVTPRKTFMHWASVDTFRPGLSVLDAGLPRKDSAEEKEERQEWTAPCYFDISIMGCGDSFGEEDFVEAIILLPSQATVDVFRKGEGALEQTAAHDSASSFTGPVSTCKAYAIADDSIFNLCLNGARIQENSGANTRVFGGQVITPAEVLSGKMMPPHEFQVLYKLLSSLCADVHCDQPGPHMDRSKPGATALCRMEERGSTLMYRMPIWLYDDDD